MNVTVPFSFGALPAQQPADLAAEAEMHRRTRQLLGPLSLIAAAVCVWALVATLSGAAPASTLLDTASNGEKFLPQELQAALTEQSVAPDALKFVDSNVRSLTLETTPVVARTDAHLEGGEFN